VTTRPSRREWLLGAVLLFGCRAHADAPQQKRKASKMTNMGQTADPLEISISQAGDDLRWTVSNRGATPVWAFLLVPSVVEGRLSFAVDSAWLETTPDGTLLVRKVDTPIPKDIDADDRIRSGAVALAPGEQRTGSIRLGREVQTRLPYHADARPRVAVKRVVLEVGWLPVRAEQHAERLTWQGQPFAYLQTEQEPGGQHFSRSSPLTWA
jgi:hypothetical protein